MPEHPAHTNITPRMHKDECRAGIASQVISAPRGPNLHRANQCGGISQQQQKQQQQLAHQDCIRGKTLHRDGWLKTYRTLCFVPPCTVCVMYATKHCCCATNTAQAQPKHYAVHSTHSKVQMITRVCQRICAHVQEAGGSEESMYCCCC